MNLQDTVTANQLKKIIQEKDKHLTYLERKLVLAEAEIKGLQDIELKSRYAEKTAKILLSAKETASRRQSIQLQQASDTINKLTARDERILRIRNLRRDELERELEAAEELIDASEV